MDTLLKNLTAYLKDQEEAMRDALKRLVLIQSGTHNKAGVDRVCREIYDLLEPLPLDRRILPQEKYGDMLIASVPSGEDGRRILLAGHMDTIFPADTPFCGWREDETHFYGPGVIDMKGGLVVGIFALKALATLGLLQGSARHLDLQFRRGDRFAGFPAPLPGRGEAQRDGLCPRSRGHEGTRS